MTYVPAIDGLRAIAVLAVIAFHIDAAWLPGGFNGVDMFYAISGFVVTGSIMARRFDGLRGLAGFFYARRLLRIMPALVVCLLATFLAGELFIPEAWIGRTATATGLAAFAGLGNVVLAASADSYFAPASALNPFAQTWSLGVEEQFYLLFPLLMAWRNRGRRAAGAVVAAISLASFVAAGLMTPQVRFYLVFGRFWELGLGMLAALTMAAWRPWLAARPRVIAALAIGAATMVGAALVMESPAFPLALLPVLGTLGLIAVAVVGGGRFLAMVPLVGIGRISYSLYLWHWPVIVLLRWTVGIEASWARALALGVTFTAALASYALVEQPCRHRWAGAPRGRVIAGVVAAVAWAAAAGWAMDKAHWHLTRSVTRNRADWYADDTPPPGRCHVAVHKHAFMAGTAIDWQPQDCAPSPMRLWVIGDSHGLALAPSLARLAVERGVTVYLRARPRCGLLTLDVPLGAACRGYARAVLDETAAHLRPGDVVLFEALRLPRLVEQDGSHLAPPPTDRPGATAEAIGIARRLVAQGARVLIPAPMPVLPAPPFRCSDAFNRGNPVCAPGLGIARARIATMRVPVLAQIAAIRAAVPKVETYDPLPALCPGAWCGGLAGGRPLFFDGDHLSGHGNRVLYPALARAVLR